MLGAKPVNREKRSLDIFTLFHALLFAYQKRVRETLGNIDIALLGIMDELTQIHGEEVDFSQICSFEDAFQKFSEFVKESGLANLSLQKTGEKDTC